MINFFFYRYVFRTSSAAEASESVYMRERDNLFVAINVEMSSPFPSFRFLTLHGECKQIKSFIVFIVNQVYQYFQYGVQNVMVMMKHEKDTFDYLYPGTTNTFK